MIKTYEDLMKKFEIEQAKLDLRTNATSKSKKQLLVCSDTGCAVSKSLELIESLKEAASDIGVDVDVIGTGCLGFCEKGPIVKVMPDDTFYTNVKPEDAVNIIDSVSKDEVLKRKLYKNPKTREHVYKSKDVPFYQKQELIALKNCGFIDAESIDEYIGAKGYQALHKALMMSPQEVIDLIKASGLRGRGGGGFPTGTKWQFAFNNDADIKYIICNADEGDPGAFMDRSILEGDPSSIIEAMAIGAYAIGAKQGYVYVRAEYPRAVERLQKAIDDAVALGLLGENIFGTDFSFDLEIRLGAGAFVCGEETALIASIEGERGMPRTKPPFPANKGLWGAPTIINNVETFANIPRIMLNGAEWYSSIGTEGSKGTKVFALAGKVNNTGLIEVPMGTTLREIIFEIGGGMAKNRKFKAVLTGGPSGGCLGEDQLDEYVDFDHLKELGSMMGSGGMIVLDDKSCMVDIAKFYLDFSVDESCGKCTPCREGTIQMHHILDKITKGQATMEDLDRLEELAHSTVNTSLCGLGQTAPNPILSTLRYFRHEYEDHILNKKCEASVCKDLISEYIITDRCTGCTICAQNCPVPCISGERKSQHVIDNDACILCGTCLASCPFDAIETR